MGFNESPEYQEIKLIAGQMQRGFARMDQLFAAIDERERNRSAPAADSAAAAGPTQGRISGAA